MNLPLNEDLFWIVPGLIGALINIGFQLYFIFRDFGNPEVDTDKVYEHFLSLFGGSIAAFLFTAIILWIALFTSVIWIPVLIRSWVIKRKLKNK
jgi:uncharacterized membrane-anchored protein